MSDKLHVYENAAIRVTYDAKRASIPRPACGIAEGVHPRSVRGSHPTRRRRRDRRRGGAGAHRRAAPPAAGRWRGPRCPTSRNSVLVSSDGPLYLRGELELMGAYNRVALHETRLSAVPLRALAHQAVLRRQPPRGGIPGIARGPGERPRAAQDDAPIGALRIEATENGPRCAAGQPAVDGRDGRGGGARCRAASSAAAGSRRRAVLRRTHQSINFTS